MVELRLDGVQDVDVAGSLADRRLPVIVTCRPTRQGGQFDGAEETRVALLEQAWALGAEYVDVESGAAPALLERSGGARIVASHHDFEKMPDDAIDRLRTLLATGAEVVKFAATVDRLSDVVTLRNLSRAADGRAVVIGMGPAGVASRILAAHLGSRWTYAGDGAAPGQLPLARMRDEFRVQTIDLRTQVYGVLGRPVGHSLSPAMHNAAFRARGVNAVYIPLEAASFDDFTEFADALDLRGASVTAPFKLDARRCAATVDAVAARVGAVNTLRRRDGVWEGCNTDLAGFMAPLGARNLRGRRAAILGAGGAARSVASALQHAGAAVTVHGRRLEEARALASSLGVRAAAWPPSADSWDVLVNATPVGTAPAVDVMPVPLDGTLHDRLVYDLVYNPPVSALLRRAGALGADTLGGLPMLVAQAAAQFHWWTNRTPPDDVMRRAALARLAPGCPTR